MTKTLIEDKTGEFVVDYGDRDSTAYYTKQVWDLGDGTFLTRYGSAHYGWDRIDTYWMTLWQPTPKWYNKKKRRVILAWATTR